MPTAPSDRSTVNSPPNPNAVWGFCSTRQCLDEGYLTDSNVPIESGYKRYLLNTDPVDQEGEEMMSPERVGDYYLQTNYSRSDIKQRIAELGERIRESE